MSRASVAALAMAAPLAAVAAGGHHGVDDASILGQGECEVDAWATHATRDDRLVHAGAQCGIAGVELGIAVEPARQDGARSDTWQLQAKWAGELRPALMVGLSVTPQWDTRASPRYQGTTVSGLLTWQPYDGWQVHANLGRDFMRGGNHARSGVAADWTTPDGQWMLALERYLESGTHFARGGVRWFASNDWTLEASRAQRLHGPRPSTWTVAATRSFGKN